MNLLVRPPAASLAGIAARAAAVADVLFAEGRTRDERGAFPAEAIDRLREAGLLLAPFPPVLGGVGLAMPEAAEALFQVLRLIGGGDLSVGRLYEGHLNAVGLVLRYGTPDQTEALAAAVHEGALSAVWNAEGRTGLRLLRDGDGWRLDGGKILASGAGSVTAPLVTAEADDGQWMLLPQLDARPRADLSSWTAAGMRCSATGSVDLTGLPVAVQDRIGAPGDYKRQPDFSGGAWRFCAVQLGAVARLVDLFRRHLVAAGRDLDPYQRQRVAHCAAAAETAALWVAKAAGLMAESAEPDRRDEVLAYVGLTRMVVERMALDVIETVERGVGLMAFIRPNPIERVARDLATYLRQPAPDGAMADAAAHVLASPSPLRDLWRQP